MFDKDFTSLLQVHQFQNLQSIVKTDLLLLLCVLSHSSKVQ